MHSASTYLLHNIQYLRPDNTTILLLAYGILYLVPAHGPGQHANSACWMDRTWLGCGNVFAGSHCQ